MSTASILPNAKNGFIDINGKPLVAGTVTFYEPGTLVPKDTWQDSAEAIPNTNPVGIRRPNTLDAGDLCKDMTNELGNLV